MALEAEVPGPAAAGEASTVTVSEVVYRANGGGGGSGGDSASSVADRQNGADGGSGGSTNPTGGLLTGGGGGAGGSAANVRGISGSNGGGGDVRIYTVSGLSLNDAIRIVVDGGGGDGAYPNLAHNGEDGADGSVILVPLF